MRYRDLYVCEKCGNYMDDVEALVFIPEIHDELPEKPVEMIGELRCIYCGSDDLEKADYCEGCDGVFTLKELKYGYCQKCRREMKNEC